MNEQGLLEKNEAEIKSLKSEIEILRNIIALIPGNVFWKDKNKAYLGCNNNVAQLAGFNSPKEIIGKQNSDFMNNSLAALTEQTDFDVYTTAKEKYIEERGFNLKHEPAIYLTKKLPLFDQQGETIGILGVSFDITERKKMEKSLTAAKKKAEALSRAKSQFLAVINHELRTPLASIIGLVDFLKRGQLPAQEEKNIVEAIENCSKHLLSLVNDVLDFSRLETRKYKLHLNIVNLDALIYEIYSMLTPLAQDKGLELQVKSHENMPKNILTDSRILRQILINLIGNAIKFTEKGCIILEIEQDEGKTCFKVTDTGQGIPQDKLDLIFEPFQQLEDAYARQSSRSGTGLGLAIVKKLAALIKAKVAVVSKVGKGSSFSLIGKFETREHEEACLINPFIKPKIKKIKVQKTFTVKPHILLVEDDPIVQYVHKKMLTDLGCIVDTVSHGRDALIKLKEHNMVFIDISLPDMSGFEVIKAMRTKSAHPQVPIIALTVYTGKEEKLACIKAGADEFATKPISQLHLKKLLLRNLK